LKKAIGEFHSQHPELLMRWNRQPESMLTIERRQAAQPEESPQHPMAHAEFVSDVEEIPPQPPSGSINMPPPSTRQATNTRGSSTIGHSIV
jgi:hypothetical protein